MLNENKKNSESQPEAAPAGGGASFESLMAQIADGSEDAVWVLLDRYTKNILRYVRRRLPQEIRGKLDSMDIVQSVWKSFLRGGVAEASRGSVDQFAAYLMGMARLKTFEKHRHYTRQAQFDVRREQPLSPTASSAADGGPPCVDYRHTPPTTMAELRDHWDVALDKSGDRGRQIVQLRLQGLTLDEVAEQMALSKSTVRRVLDSMLQSLTS